MDSCKINSLSAIDLFSGAGGFSLAAQNLGVDILAAVEFNKDSCESYRKNISSNIKNEKHKLFESDILELSPKDVLKQTNLKPQELDLLIGGPPCQGFSKHRFKDQGVDDPRNKLLLRYFDYVEELLPKVFLVENVSGLLWKRHELYLSRFLKLAKQLGYNVKAPILVDAKDYGVPQNRKRVFILGVREDLEEASINWPPEATHYSPKSGKNPTWITSSTIFETPPSSVLSVLKKIEGDGVVDNLVFGESIKSVEEDPCAINMMHCDDLVQRFSRTAINGSRDNSLKCHQNGYQGHKDVYGRIKLAQPGATITTGCNNPSKGRFLHPWKNHGITLRHAARFQNFPDDFIFYGGSISQAKQIGNAVPIKLGEVMIKESIRLLEHHSSKQCVDKKKRA